MSVRKSSKDALKRVIDSGELSNMQRVVYEALFTYGPCTANELYKRLVGRKKINQANITTRLGELRAMGSVREKGKRTCTVTKMTVLVWECTHKVPIKPAPKPTKQEKIDHLKRVVIDATERFEQIVINENHGSRSWEIAKEFLEKHGLV